MKNTTHTGPSARRRLGIGEIASYGLTAGAVLLAWQVVIQPLVQRAPVEIAVGVAPNSPIALRRAAESELAAGRVDNAASLARDALTRSPFDVRALRVVGLTEARAGREDQADQILTLAGNWSLRDDPSHAWLVGNRLRRGDYASAFAHADTLVRRREDVQPQVFQLFTTAGVQDPERAEPLLATLLSTRPPWRTAYLNGLRKSPQDLQLAINLAVLLQADRAPLSNNELQVLYANLLEQRQIQAVGLVRRRLGRPSPDLAVTNGGFAEKAATAPFQWRLTQKAGIGVEISPDDLQPSNPALRVDYDGYAAGTVAEQLTSLSPGVYRFTAQARNETGGAASRLAWTLSCATHAATLGSVPVKISRAPDAWSTVEGRLEVPSSCPVQWLRLETRAGDSRSPVVVWFDRIALSVADQGIPAAQN